MATDYTLAYGTHATPEEGRCAMEWVSYLAGEPHGDERACVSPVLRAFCMTLNDTLEQADYRVKAGAHSSSRVWPTGFIPLDEYLSGGFRSGDLILLGGAQGLGKTTMIMQMARNIARAGRSVLVFSYEHDQQTSLIRLVALEAGQLPRSFAGSGGDMRDPEAGLGQRRVRGDGGGRAERRAGPGEHVREVLPVQAQDGRTAVGHQAAEQAPERVSQIRSG